MGIGIRNLIGTLLAAFAVSASLASAADALAPADQRCAVWNRELQFATSVAEHDYQGFAALLADGAVFVNGSPPHFEGIAAIVAGWRGIVEGKSLVLRWHPDYIAIGGDGRTALSRGSYTLEDPAVNPETAFRIGVFQSVWIKSAHDQWKVMFDGGGPQAKPATAKEVYDLQASWKKHCPYL